jgi:hypothetical protein
MTPAANFATSTAGVVIAGQRYRLQIYLWCQIIGTISDCSHFKVNLKEEIYLYVSPTPVVRKSPRIFKKIRNGPSGIRAWGILIHEKN